MGTKVFEIVTEDEAAKLMKEQMEIDPEKLEHYSNLFEQWISTQQQLQQVGFSKLCWRNFLIWSKLDLQKAKRKFIKYCYSSLTHKELVSGRELTPEADLKCLKYMYILGMPKLTTEKYRVTIVQLFRPEIFDVLEACRYAILSYDYLIHKENFLVGNVGIVDMQNFGTNHYSRLFTATLFRCLKFGSENYPLNVKKVIIINLDSVMEKGVNLCLTIIPEKIRKRVVILKSHKDLHKHIPKECLPSDYGGDSKSFEEIRVDWTNLLLENRDFLERMWNAKPTGPLPKEIVLDDDSFGVEGSFRQLSID